MIWKSILNIGMPQSTSFFSTPVTHAAKLSHPALILRRRVSSEVSGCFVVFDDSCPGDD